MRCVMIVGECANGCYYRSKGRRRSLSEYEGDVTASEEGIQGPDAPTTQTFSQEHVTRHIIFSERRVDNKYCSSHESSFLYSAVTSYRYALLVLPAAPLYSRPAPTRLHRSLHSGASVPGPKDWRLVETLLATSCAGRQSV